MTYEVKPLTGEEIIWFRDKLIEFKDLTGLDLSRFMATIDVLRAELETAKAELAEAQRGRSRECQLN